MRNSIRRPFVWVFIALGGVAAVAVLAFLFGFIVMALWNWLIPELFGIRAITYWEAWGLVLLAHIFFKAGRWEHDRDRRDHAPETEWKDRFRQRFKGRFFPGEGPSTRKPEEPAGESPEEPPRDSTDAQSPPGAPGQA